MDLFSPSLIVFRSSMQSLPRELWLIKFYPYCILPSKQQQIVACLLNFLEFNWSKRSTLEIPRLKPMNENSFQMLWITWHKSKAQRVQQVFTYYEEYGCPTFLFKTKISLFEHLWNHERLHSQQVLQQIMTKVTITFLCRSNRMIAITAPISFIRHDIPSLISIIESNEP